jgi:hypothetical protein
MTLVPGSGGEAVTWTPTFADIALGSVSFTVEVDDGDGGADSVACSGIPLTYVDVDADGLPDTWETAQGVSDPAADPDADGRDNLQEWTDGTDPNVSDAPSTPVPDAPVGGADVTDQTPALSWQNATSPPGDPLTYDVEVYDDAQATTLLASISGSPEGAGTSSWTVDVTLADNAAAAWRVRAADSFVASPWTDLQPFFVDLENEPPTVPTVVQPEDGSIVALETLDFELGASTDPEGDPLSYLLEIHTDASLETLVASETISGPVPAAWTFEGAVEDTSYFWRARAVDSEGAESDWGGPWQVLWSRVDDPPAAVEFAWPLDGGQSELLAPVFELVGAADPEALPVTFEIEMSLDEDFSSEVSTSGEIVEDAPGEVVWDSSLGSAPYLEDALGWARARAVDPADNASDWTTISFTPNVENDPPTEPTLVSPVGGADVEGDVVLVVGNASDSDGNRRTYEFELSAAGEVVWSTVVEEGEVETSALVEEALEPGDFSWRARALDELELGGPWAGPETFSYVVPGDDDDDDDSAGDSSDGCEGCGSSFATGATGGWMIGLVALAWRRRR